MTNGLDDNLPATPRTVICERCGASFGCDLSGECWCASEPVRLPVPGEASREDCLCRDCLRAEAAAQKPQP